MEWITNPWPWYVAGIIIGLTVPALLIIGNKSFGISSVLRHICAACLPANISFFKYNWKKEAWNLFFVGGIAIGGVIATQFLSYSGPVRVAENTRQVLAEYQVEDTEHLLPEAIFSWTQLTTLRGFVFIVLGGFLVGFGTRYAGGCTSGHAIMGLSNLQLPSLIATIAFMAGGFMMTWFILPFLLRL